MAEREYHIKIPAENIDRILQDLEREPIRRGCKVVAELIHKVQADRKLTTELLERGDLEEIRKELDEGDITTEFERFRLASKYIDLGGNI